ncbi:FAD-dependent oxidoreductase [Pseudoflavitalea sp. G-6-1-2]|uniref:NAD(P)/FAD-dependent oxidoreductase n=1 Tax=Pseudoflavitalea sp. G-6-1-2 TaxID=2728841 RepID=UPI00146CEF4F|nr:FAD-dependent oxidoreductase [Pseudoflavitalea sp. G-6-1-2]NML23949.1 FAD-dependent oxidoreductase [Pseudoflavitalea sp. G-6-1-2]
MTQQVTIAGGGVIGLCCAYYLQKKGISVTVIDRGDITNGTSFGNAGYVSPSHIHPLASPGIVAKGLRWMLSSGSPFYIKPRLNADLIRWCFAFWRNANQATMDRNIPPLFNILSFSRDLTSEIKNDIGNHFRMQEIGIFMMYKNAATEKHEFEIAKEANALGLETIVCDAKQVQDMETEVEVQVRGGVLYPIDCHLHPGDFMRTMKAHLEKAGVRFQLNTTITGFEKQGDKVTAVLTDKGKFDCGELVLTPGSWLPELNKQLGIHMLLQGGKGYSMTFEKIERNLKYPAILVDHRTAMTPMGADLRMGGTMEISGLGSPTLIKRAQAIFNAAKLYYPDLPVSFPATEKIWSGYRPLTPDGLPYIGRHSRYSNLVIACGHAMLGLSLAAGTGKLVEELVSHSPTSIDCSAFNVERK